MRNSITCFIIALTTLSIFAQKSTRDKTVDIVEGIKLLQQATMRTTEIPDSLLLQIASWENLSAKWDDKKIIPEVKQVLESDTIVLVTAYYNNTAITGYILLDIYNDTTGFYPEFSVEHQNNGHLIWLKEIYVAKMFDMNGPYPVEWEDLFNLLLYNWILPIPQSIFIDFEHRKMLTLTAVRIIRHNNHTEYNIYSPIKPNMNIITTSTVRKYYE